MCYKARILHGYRQDNRHYLLFCYNNLNTLGICWQLHS
ncbi:hypothetical protein RNAN_0985 [Rheinheimera nanhaiensis E407-8]|uniref:Transposase n=1 Tax=Rheinheimera nanhaiensis E407-8 TaxID=562729 RepID=I1DVD6_9GAMM|nr:hypothetical protein RNAN_0985 [Rheinheimera nanhaiensis E407-8]